MKQLRTGHLLNIMLRNNAALVGVGSGRRSHTQSAHVSPVSKSRFPERSTAGQATSSGVVERVCGVGLRAKHFVGRHLQAVLISSSSNNAYRMEARSVDAPEPLHWGAPHLWHPPPAEGGIMISRLPESLGSEIVRSAASHLSSKIATNNALG
jgi:hypothetical protein